MNLQEFIKIVKEMLQERLGGEYMISEYSAPKNNKPSLSGMVIQMSYSDVGMAVYLDDVFEEYQEGGDLDGIIDTLFEKIKKAEIPDKISTDFLKVLMESYEAARPAIYCKLVNQKANLKMLEKVPYIPFLDLAIIFYIEIDKTEEGQMGITINNRIMESWGIDSQQLYQDTMYHMEKCAPQRLENLNDIMRELFKNTKEDEEQELFQMLLMKCEEDIGLYCLNNSTGFGAASLLYGDCITKFSEKINSDVLILPSSIHEVLLMADDGSRDKDELLDMVKSVNQNEVPREEMLSNSIYRYDRMTKKISIAYQGEDL